MGILKYPAHELCFGLFGALLACSVDSRTVGLSTTEPDAESPGADSGEPSPPPITADRDANPGPVPCDACPPSDPCAEGGENTACTVDSLAGQCTTGGQCVEFCVLDLSNVDECLLE